VLWARASGRHAEPGDARTDRRAAPCRDPAALGALNHARLPGLCARFAWLLYSPAGSSLNNSTATAHLYCALLRPTTSERARLALHIPREVGRARPEAQRVVFPEAGQANNPQLTNHSPVSHRQTQQLLVRIHTTQESVLASHDSSQTMRRGKGHGNPARSGRRPARRLEGGDAEEPAAAHAAVGDGARLGGLLRAPEAYHDAPTRGARPARVRAVRQPGPRRPRAPLLLRPQLLALRRRRCCCPVRSVGRR